VNTSDPEAVKRYADLEKSQAPHAYFNRG